MSKYIVYEAPSIDCPHCKINLLHAGVTEHEEIKRVTRYTPQNKYVNNNVWDVGYSCGRCGVEIGEKLAKRVLKVFELVKND